ncbi:uncharacterized protein LOC134857333 [Symsagittifera roscoffensis]|uniref:uncharacterized protein LOC134857333 n=1 Tax=Symsagittifera roscoffensis TaxID=84072 RepID=UPI00307C80E0
MSQKFASGRAVGTRMSAENFAKYFQSKKRGSRQDRRESQEPNEFQFDPDFKPFLLSHRKTNITTAIFMIVSGACMLLVSPFCSYSVSSSRCWTSESLKSVYSQALVAGESIDRIRWIYGLRYIGGFLLGIGIFYFILIVQFHSWRHKMGIDLANKQSRMAASSENDGHSSNFNVYDIMVKAWVRDQRTLDKKCQEMEDENLPVIDADSIKSVDSENFMPPSPFTYHSPTMPRDK